MSSDPSDEFFGEPLAFEVLGASTIEDHCLTLRGELQGLRTTIESRRQPRASLPCDANRRPSQSSQDTAAQVPTAREALDHHKLRAELVQDYEKRLAAMHVQLLAKQHEFEAYRHTVEHDLKQQLRHAQPQLVKQLVDKSVAMSVETKMGFLESLHGHVELEQLQKEDLAFKQTLLKLQTLHHMQREIRDVESEKERTLQKAQRLRSTQLMNENAELQQRLRQLETDVVKVSQERSLFQGKYADLQKHNELAAQRRREAKVRALSAPYRRRLDGIQEPGDQSQQRPHDYQQQQDAFEAFHEVRIRSPRHAAIKSADATTTQEEAQRFRNATRHFQNEIKRLQQQLTHERKLKTQLMDQVTQLLVKAAAADMDEQDHNDGGDDTTESPSASNQKRPDRYSASPRVRAASASVCSPQRVLKVAVMALRRPSTSFSPRMPRPPAGKMDVSPAGPRNTVSPGYDAHATGAGHAQLTSPKSSPPRSAAASATSTRKFQVHQRDPPVVKIGGVAGVQNALSARERLPYR